MAEPLNEYGPASDLDSGKKNVLLDPPLFTAGCTSHDATARGLKVLDQLGERLEWGSFSDFIRLGSYGGPDAIGAEKDHGLLATAKSGRSDDKGYRGLVRVLFAVIERNAEAVRHK
jgi:hypothetical protein